MRLIEESKLLDDVPSFFCQLLRPTVLSNARQSPSRGQRVLLFDAPKFAASLNLDGFLSPAP